MNGISDRTDSQTPYNIINSFSLYQVGKWVRDMMLQEDTILYEWEIVFSLE